MHFRTASIRDGVYCDERRINRRKEWVEWEPQPTLSDVIVMSHKNVMPASSNIFHVLNSMIRHLWGTSLQYMNALELSLFIFMA